MRSTPCPATTPPGEAAIGAAIRSDWLENLGLAVPTTLEELEAVFYAFAQDDPDGNGQDDTYALSAGGNSGAMGRYMFQSIFGIFGVNPLFWTENEEGELEYGFTTDEVKEALKLLSKWYADGLIDPEFITTDARSKWHRRGQQIRLRPNRLYRLPQLRRLSVGQRRPHERQVGGQ